MQSPRTWGEMQSLAGKLAALNYFLSRRGRKHFPRAQEDGLRPTGLNNPFAERNPICIPSGITRSGERSTASGKERKATPGALCKVAAVTLLRLPAYNITYEPRSAIKGQILADFINEVPVGSEAMVPRQTQYTIDHDKEGKEEWILYTDGAASAKGSGAGLPEDQNEARAIRMKINQYVMEEWVLFKRSYLMPMLRCVGPLQANYVIREIHMGACNMLLKARSMVAKGMDVLGPLPEAPWKVRFLIVVVDYFTKWIKAKPLAKTIGKEVKKFVWDNIVCRYRLPKIIVTDNGTNFIHDPFKSWCKKLNTTQINTVVAHPQANGLVEMANRSLMEGIKTRLGRERKGWVDELPNVLWAHRTLLKTSNGETPYSLTFGSEAVIPTKIGMPTHRTMMIKEGSGNEEEMRLNLNQLKE
ncbi:reverse transcriptase domain-containing protein [Tanacetum coccineum]|uniref:Reverse transcriptase domain-containing protein n=1 Tax=Tanacetum coccineum TaxID=301880 RepID=A0ABQ5A3U4_9ASTR